MLLTGLPSSISAGLHSRWVTSLLDGGGRETCRAGVVISKVNCMGLDQYLYAKNYLSPMEWRGEEMNKTFHQIADAIGVKDFMDKDLPSIQCQVKIGYWRKANAIHDWFIQNCQDGHDDCRESYVSIENLEELRKVCKMVLDNHALASEHLPTSQGFFFGSQDYDEWYFKDLESTVQIIDNALSKVSDEWSFSYQSSW